jgi:hypothetical protein
MAAVITSKITINHTLCPLATDYWFQDGILLCTTGDLKRVKRGRPHHSYIATGQSV